MDGTHALVLPAPRAWTRLPRGWVFLLGFATLMGMLESAKAYVEMYLKGGSPTVWQALLGNLPWWLSWVVLAVPIVAVSRRWRIDRPGRLAAGAVHAAAAFVLSAAHIASAGTLYYYTDGYARYPSVAALLTTLTNTFLLLDLLTYVAIAGGFYTLEYYRRSREGELAAERLRGRAARMELLAREAQLSALRSQIHPHFLFNTLNAISGLVRRAETGDAVQMIARLGDLLRASMSHADGEEVPLERELALLRNYLDIERIRFRDRLAVVYQLDEGLLCARVPSLLLQPLVENAIRHGISPVPGPGCVTLRGRRAGDELVLEVENTGAEMDAASQPPREGIGLANTRARLAHLYGRAASLRLERIPGGGAVARVVLPLHTTEDTLTVAAVGGGISEDEHAAGDHRR